MSNVKAISTNKKVIFVPFHWGHPYAMDLRPLDKAMLTDIPNYTDYLKAYAASGTAYTAIHDSQMVCSFGVNLLWPKVGEAWMLTSHHVDGVPMSLTKGAIRFFNQCATDLPLKRLQITVDSRNKVAVQWASLLQFKQEGVLEKDGPSGSDYFMYARIY